MSEFKIYTRRVPFMVRARPLGESETVYDANGQPLRYWPGDMLIELETDRYTLDRALFDQLYMEAPIHANGTDAQVPPT